MSVKIKALFLALMLLLAALAAGCDIAATPETPPQAADGGKQQPGANDGAGDGVRLTVYYATADAMQLVPEVWVVPKTAHPTQDALELLLKNPQNRELVKVMPDGVIIKGLVVKDHIAYVDFNEKLVKNAGGSATEMLLVGSIVNTLTEFVEIHKVQILVEGKKLDTLSGHMDISVPLSRSDQIIKKSL